MKTVINLPQSPGAPAALPPDTGDAPSAAPDASTEAAAPAAPRIERSQGPRVGTRASAAAAATAAAPSRHGSFVPLLLFGLAVLGWLVFQGVMLLGDRQTLQAAHAAQQQTVDNAGKLRSSLDTLAADTQRMADAGNANARLLVEELRKRGVTINPAASTAPR